MYHLILSSPQLCLSHFTDGVIVVTSSGLPKITCQESGLAGSKPMLPVFTCILTLSLVGGMMAQVKRYGLVPVDLSLVCGSTGTSCFLNLGFSPLCVFQVLHKVLVFCPTQIT